MFKKVLNNNALGYEVFLRGGFNLRGGAVICILPKDLRLYIFLLFTVGLISIKKRGMGVFSTLCLTFIMFQAVCPFSLMLL